MNEEIIAITEKFNIEGAAVSAAAFGNGHINDTYLVKTENKRYVLQRVNDHVFSCPEEVMENIAAVTEFTGGPLKVIPACDGRLWHRSSGGFWRLMTYVENSCTCESAPELEIIREAGRAYGAFIHGLSAFPAEKLHVTIDRFHDTRWRYDNLMKACKAGSRGRMALATEEIDFAKEHEKDVDVLNRCAAGGEIPVRVTHNDTKINNVLFDRVTGKAVCVIDLDTVMPGLAVCDFGDAVRSGAAGQEDEADPEKAGLDIGLYRSLREGFAEGCPELTQREKELLPWGAKLMALECGIRFLTDYLEGDHYFKTDYPGHNLIRCRAQFRLVRSMEENWDEMVNW